MDLCRRNNIRIGNNNRYMDDIRAFYKALREGWRWMEGGLCYTKDWSKRTKCQESQHHEDLLTF